MQHKNKIIFSLAFIGVFCLVGVTFAQAPMQGPPGTGTLPVSNSEEDVIFPQNAAKLSIPVSSGVTQTVIQANDGKWYTENDDGTVSEANLSEMSANSSGEQKTSIPATPNITSVNPNSASGPYKNQEKIPGAEPTTEFIPYLKSIINFGFAIIGILALFMLIIGAYQYLMAAGSGNASDAKDTITSALLGLVLGLTAWIILNKINPDLVKMNPIKQIVGTVGPAPGATAPGTAPGGTTPIPTTTNPTTAPAEILQKAKEYAAKHGVPETIAMNMLNAESGGNVYAVSSKGASGLLQLMPGTAMGLGVRNIFDVDENLNAGYRYMSQQYAKYGSWEYAAAAYNMGPNGFDAFLAGKRGLPKETNGYVKKVMGGCSFCT